MGLGRSFAGCVASVALLLVAAPAHADPETRATRAHLGALQRALEAYRAEAGALPQSGAQLGTVASVRAPSVPVDRGVPLDGWGHPFVYRVLETPRGFELYSAGPNGTDDGGGGDDVALPEGPDAQGLPELATHALRAFPVLLLLVLAPIVWAVLRSARRSLR